MIDVLHVPGPGLIAVRAWFPGWIGVSCHSEAIATGGLVLETYDAAMTGTPDGLVILVGDADGSPLVEVQRAGHFATLDDDVLQIVIEWIKIGAPEE